MSQPFMHPAKTSRQHPRLRVAAPYTLIRVRPVGEDRYRWTGHIYDVSLSGMRFELDEALPAGTAIEVRALLPGKSQTVVRVTGRVARIHDDKEPGPARMGLMIDSFQSELDRERLASYLHAAGLIAAQQDASHARAA